MMKECEGKGKGEILKSELMKVDFINIRKRKRRIVDEMLGGGDKRIFKNKEI